MANVGLETLRTRLINESNDGILEDIQDPYFMVGIINSSGDKFRYRCDNYDGYQDYGVNLFISEVRFTTSSSTRVIMINDTELHEIQPIYMNSYNWEDYGTHIEDVVGSNSNWYMAMGGSLYEVTIASLSDYTELFSLACSTLYDLKLDSNYIYYSGDSGVFERRDYSGNLDTDLSSTEYGDVEHFDVGDNSIVLIDSSGDLQRISKTGNHYYTTSRSSTDNVIDIHRHKTYVYISRDDGTIEKRNISDGSIVWEKTFTDTIHQTVVRNNSIHVLHEDSDGTYYVDKYTDSDFTLIWSYQGASGEELISFEPERETVDLPN